MAHQQPTENRTKQRKPSVGKGGVPTPDGFEKYPERRHNGAWKKEDTPRYKLEQMMKLDDAALLAIYEDKTAPLFERKIAQALNKGDWKTIREMIHEVYGKPRENMDIKVEQVKPILGGESRNELRANNSDN